MSSTANAERRTQLESLWEHDAVKIIAVIGAIYIVYALIGLILGYSLDGIVNTLRRMTYLIAVYGMVTLALNLHWGYTGLFNIGVAGFMAIGLYVTMILAKPADPGGAAQYAGLGLPMPIAIIGGVVAAGLAGLVVALPALRLRADYFAITTIAFAEIVRLGITSDALQQFTILGAELGTGGGRGLIRNYDDPMNVIFQLEIFSSFVDLTNSLFGFGPTQARALAYSIVLVLVLAGIYWLIQRTSRSPFGRVLKAIREDEEAAQSLGKDTNMFKIKVFVLGCALMGLAGILWRFRRTGVTPEAFRPHVTFYIWIALIIGGAGSNTGSILGSGLFVAVLFEGPQYLRRVIDHLVAIGDAPNTFAGAVGPLLSANPVPLVRYTFAEFLTLQFVIMGVALILLMQRRPDGLLGHREETAAAIPLGARPSAAGGGSGGDGSGGSGSSGGFAHSQPRDQHDGSDQQTDGGVDADGTGTQAGTSENSDSRVSSDSTDQPDDSATDGETQ
ncbi:branched-chain amino acid ABC transporter permease [Natrialba sp. SSL1]|uniref:branched-chain amino acid ABC transporter permease n=1 Tax=Natrialba sp. SSL1 TaxID=1869245 RepID=UPI0008F80E7D|nr:branched-chain amino acid ABC transporter permease [Natrialba sp. SSL1]OIB57122.1 branched-chain amino acid ABC transporter permease [Natrialba sp. SSL1]